MARWVVEHGGHVNPNLPRYARVPLLVLEGRWREAREVLAQQDISDLPYLAGVRPLYLGTLARAQGDAEAAWRCVHETAQIRAASEPGELVGQMPVQFQLFAARLALDAGDLDSARGWLDLHRRWLDFMEATLGRVEGEVLETEWHRAAGEADRALDHAERALAHAITAAAARAARGARRISASSPMMRVGRRMRAQFARRLRSLTRAVAPTSAPSLARPRRPGCGPGRPHDGHGAAR